ncbi:meiotic recombination protein REC114 isoform X1 [Anguilla anguilla]|uniref:meiotic recombination protein REC114 isoform X1 n=1 Tax=Anguilla anguilla TaxID=7936 RepID=UPI0015A86899|nr:meiotic recombination protein REC114 isoform X1 [Anguilla anguilla]
MAAKIDSKGKQNDEVFNTNKSCWRLKRYGRFLPPTSKCDRTSSWKVFEPSDTAGHLALTIVQSGHLLVSQDQELLEGFSLIGAPSFLKVQRKSDILLFRMMAKGESRMFRLQFEGSSREEALEECASAARRLQEYLPVGAPQTNPPPSAQEHGTSMEETSDDVPGVKQDSVSVRELVQSFLGQPGSSLPLAYCHSALPSQELGPFLRLCLLDHSFPALVEEVENELKKLAQD